MNKHEGMNKHMGSPFSDYLIESLFDDETCLLFLKEALENPDVSVGDRKYLSVALDTIKQVRCTMGSKSVMRRLAIQNEGKMTIKTLASKIAKLEGKKSEARIGDIREILGILSDLVFTEDGVAIYDLLDDNGEKRAKKKPKKKV